MAFNSREVRSHVLMVTAGLAVDGGSSLSEDVIRSNGSERLAIVQSEIYETGGGRLFRGFDCTGCYYANSCSCDECRRMG